MERVLSVCAAVALLALSGTFAAGTETSRFAAAGVGAVERARTDGDWKWRYAARLRTDDVVLQSELNAAFVAVSRPGPATLPEDAFLQAVQQTATWRVIVAAARRCGFESRTYLELDGLSITADADGGRLFDARLAMGGRSADVTAGFRVALEKLRHVSQDEPVSLGDAPEGWRDGEERGKPSFMMRSGDVNGRCTLDCSYRTEPEGGCPWREQVRKLSPARPFDRLDRAETWRLLGRRPDEYGSEEVLNVLGRPTRSVMRHCGACGGQSMCWAYEAEDANRFGEKITHTLVFVLRSDGRCTGWSWRVE